MRPITRVLTATAAVLALGAAPVAASSDFTIKGAGNGHGVGMSQYGAYGQALAGRTTGQILSTYYTGTTTGSRTVDFDPRIAVGRDQVRTQVVIRGASARVTAAGRTFTNAAVNSVWTVDPLSGTTCRTRTTGVDESGACPTFDPNSGGQIEVRLYDASAKQFRRHHAYGRASVVEVIADRVGTSNRLDTVVELPMEQYLYGLGEMPYSWHPEALKAQAIAGRSFALHRLIGTGANPDRGCSCHLWDSQQDQVFQGHDRETSGQWARWQDAVNDTAGLVVLTKDASAVGTRNGIVQAFYSSSSSGRTESKEESQSFSSIPWPYMVSVDDPWSLQDDIKNPHRSWTAIVPGSTAASKVGFDTVTSIDITSKSQSGAALQVRFRGVKDGKRVESLRTGDFVRRAFGLRSTHLDAVFLPPFVDDDGNVHEQSIVWLASQGITNGCNPPTLDRFCPSESVTRGQMAAFLVRTLNLSSGSGGNFKDTAVHTFENDIDALRASGITVGCNPPANDRFCPNEAVTRAQMASFLVRARDHARDPLPTTGKDFFVDDRGNVHEQSINRIRVAGITSGCNPPAGDRFCPGDQVTRAQMASFLRNAFG